MTCFNSSYFNSLLNKSNTKNIVSWLMKLQTEITNITLIESATNGKSIAADESISLDKGLAVAPDIAAWCFMDYLRTHRFMKAIYQASKLKVNQYPHRKVNILYAGCGPYCPLILPLLYLFNSSDITITLVEINSKSIKAAKKLIDSLNKRHFINEIICINATEYTPKKLNEFDIIISETMDKALQIEPQVSIFLNLYPYLKKDGILIPEEISVDLYTTDIRNEKSPSNPYYIDTTTHEENKKQRTFISKLISVNKSFLKTYQSVRNCKFIYLETIDLLNLKTKKTDFLYITKLKIFDSITLTEDESLLTLKVYALTLTPEISKSKIKFSYRLDQDPRIVKEFIPD